MATDPLTAIQQLQSVITTLAPVLCPQLLPRGSKYGLDLIVSLCKTEEQRQTLLALVRSKQLHATKAFSTQKDENNMEKVYKDEDLLEPQVIGVFDVNNRVFALQKVQWMHKCDAAVHEFSRFMELQLENSVAAHIVVHHFLKVNGHKPDNFILAQQCFSAAFALQTLLCALPKLPIAVDGKVVEITENTDVAEVFAPLFVVEGQKMNTSKVKAAKVQKLAVRSKSKQQKVTKRKKDSA